MYNISLLFNTNRYGWRFVTGVNYVIFILLLYMLVSEYACTLFRNNILFEPPLRHDPLCRPHVVLNTLTTHRTERTHAHTNVAESGLMRKIRHCVSSRKDLYLYADGSAHRSYLNLSPLSARRRTNATRVTLPNHKNIRHSSCVALWELEPGGFLKLRHISSLSLPPSVYIYVCNTIGRCFVEHKQQ